MLKSLSFAFILLALQEAVLSQQVPRPADARTVADQATEAARSGRFDEALRLYNKALTLSPDNVSILRDYAVVLGWAEKYAEALPIIRKVLATPVEQPDWALREFARSLLFADETEEALQRLNQLLE